MTEDYGCVRDGTWMERRVAGPAALWVCPSCHGIWIGGPDVEALLQSPHEAWKLPWPEVAPVPLSAAAASLMCFCNAMASMKTVTRDGISIDVCPECGGIWCDGGELEELVRLQEARDRGEESARGTGTVIGLEILLDLLRGLFGDT